MKDDTVVECVDAPTSVFSIHRTPIRPPIPVPSPHSIPVVVGCRFPNCGLQAGEQSPIEFRITAKSNLATSAVLGIESMSATKAAGIEILQGEVDRRDPFQWSIRSAVTRLRGYFDTNEMHPPVITLRPLPDETTVQALTKHFREIRRLGALELGKIEINVEQLLDNFVVSQKRVRIEFRLCGFEPERLPQDQITLQNHSGTPNATLLLNGRRHSNGNEYDCVNKERRAAVETHIGGNILSLGNMLSNGSCYSEASVFLQDRAMRLKVIDSTPPTWTVNPTDIVPVDVQQPPIQVPVNLWVLWSSNTADPLAQARTDLGEANTLYGETQSGIQFYMPSGSPEESDNSNLLTATCVDVEGSQGLKSAVGYVTNQLNVYYVKEPPPREPEQARGWHCVTEDENVIIIRAAITKRATLAHELGHALSLQTHAEYLQDELDEKGNTVFDATNIMWATLSQTAVDKRSRLTKGQSFRGNISEGSALHRLSILGTPAVSPGRQDCTEHNNDISAMCPWIGAD